MVSELSRYLNNSDDMVYACMNACDSIASTKFVMAERKISDLLVLIASSTVMHKIVASASKGYDFQSSLATARVKTGHVTSLVVPPLTNDQIAFAINILYEIDNGTISLREFLDEFYYSGGGISFAYSSFVRSVILPLKQNIEVAYKQLRFSIAPPDGANEMLAVYDAIDEVKRYVRLEPAIDDRERNELLTHIKAILSGLRELNLTQVRNMFNALSHIASTMPVSKSLYDRLSELDECLSVCKI